MARLMSEGFGALIVRPAAYARWELRYAARAFTRRFGMSGWALLACAICAVLALAVDRRQAALAGALEMRLAAQLAGNGGPAKPVFMANQPLAAGAGDARARLKAFDDQLLSHDAIPFVVQELLDLGEAEGLSMQRGAYRPQVDVAGRFLRYRMTLPVKGQGPEIQRFMKAALRKQKNLVLDSVQFKRARIGSTDIEARIQWVILAALPAESGTAQ